MAIGGDHFVITVATALNCGMIGSPCMYSLLSDHSDSRLLADHCETVVWCLTTVWLSSSVWPLWDCRLLSDHCGLSSAVWPLWTVVCCLTAVDCRLLDGESETVARKLMLRSDASNRKFGKTVRSAFYWLTLDIDVMKMWTCNLPPQPRPTPAPPCLGRLQCLCQWRKGDDTACTLDVSEWVKLDPDKDTIMTSMVSPSALFS